MKNQGHLYIKDVVFDGDNYGGNDNGDSLWKIDGSLVTVIFENCVFTNNDALYDIRNGANVTFIDCLFEHNILTTSAGYSATNPWFDIYDAIVEFDECTFKNNSFDSRSLFKLSGGGILELNECDFIGNTDIGDGSTSIITLTTANTINFLDISGNIFVNNDGFNTDKCRRRCTM